jgi:hypothetical protein
MIIIGAVLLIMVISSTVIVSVCMLSSQGNRRLEQNQDLATNMGDRWSGTRFGGKYATSIPHFNFEPEEMESLPGSRRF